MGSLKNGKSRFNMNRIAITLLCIFYGFLAWSGDVPLFGGNEILERKKDEPITAFRLLGYLGTSEFVISGGTPTEDISKTLIRLTYDLEKSFYTENHEIIQQKYERLRRFLEKIDNPLLHVQVLPILYESILRMLEFCHGESQSEWQWNSEQIEALVRSVKDFDLTDIAVTFMNNGRAIAHDNNYNLKRRFLTSTNMLMISSHIQQHFRTTGAFPQSMELLNIPNKYTIDGWGKKIIYNYLEGRWILASPAGGEHITYGLDNFLPSILGAENIVLTSDFSLVRMNLFRCKRLTMKNIRVSIEANGLQHSTR